MTNSIGPAVPCDHIATYYQHAWENRKCIAYNLLRRGYLQCAKGLHHDKPENNLYEVSGHG